MKKAAEFLKTTLLGGLVAVVPLAVIAFVLWSILSSLIEVINAMEGVLPFSPLTNTLVVFLAALLALLLVCFLAGLALRTADGESIKDRVDGVLVRVVPLYGMARKLAGRLSGEVGQELTAAEIDLHGSPSRVLGFVVETLPDGRSAVFVPSTPVASVGQIYLVPGEAVHPLDAPLTEMVGPLTEWGAGSARLYETRRATDPE